jgi:hypothetical protein
VDTLDTAILVCLLWLEDLVSRRSVLARTLLYSLPSASTIRL